MTDNLDTLHDNELSEVFAVEVAGYVLCENEPPMTNGDAPGKFCYRDRSGRFYITEAYDCGVHAEHPRWGYEFHRPKLATSADAVLPWLEKWHDADVQHRDIRICRRTALDWLVVLRVRPSAMSDWTEPFQSTGTLPRAACIALIRAKRAEKP